MNFGLARLSHIPGEISISEGLGQAFRSFKQRRRTAKRELSGPKFEEVQGDNSQREMDLEEAWKLRFGRYTTGMETKQGVQGAASLPRLAIARGGVNSEWKDKQCNQVNQQLYWNICSDGIAFLFPVDLQHPMPLTIQCIFCPELPSKVTGSAYHRK